MTNENRNMQIETFYREHYDEVLKFCANWLSCSTANPDARDAASEAMMRSIAAWDRYDAGKSARKTWVLTIAKRQMIKASKKHSKLKEVLTDDIVKLEVYAPPPPATLRGDMGLLRTVLSLIERHEGVNIPQYTAWLLLYMGFTLREVGTMLGVTGQAINGRSKRFSKFVKNLDKHRHP